MFRIKGNDTVLETTRTHAQRNNDHVTSVIRENTGVFLIGTNYTDNKDFNANLNSHTYVSFALWRVRVSDVDLFCYSEINFCNKE